MKHTLTVARDPLKQSWRAVSLYSALTALLLTPLAALHAAEDIQWLVSYEAKALPDSTWSAVGKPNAKIENGALHLVDDSATESGAFRAAWKPQPDTEIVVEAKVRVEFVKARRDGTGMWPAQQGVPVGLLVSDGKHQEGLLLCPERIANWHDRVAFMDASKEFHTYRLVIRGNDMSITVDGVEKIHGEGAFWKPAENGEAFVQFGSTAPGWKGGAFWQSVKLGVRKASAHEKPKLRITVSEPWEIPPTPGWNKPRARGEALRTADTEIGIAVPDEAKGKPVPPTRPYLYDVGKGMLMLSVAQGPDAIYEPYGVLKSTDVGKTWQPVADLQFKTFAPLPHIRMTDGDILGFSRWNVKYQEGIYVGMSFRFDAKAEKFTMFENLIQVPKKSGQIVAFDRDIFDLGKGELMAVVYTPISKGVMHSYLMKSADAGKTWNYFSTIGAGPEPSVVRFSDTEMMAILRTLSFGPLWQTWSHDGGKTWDKLKPLEVGSVAPDMVLMNNGVLACSYGRPGSNLMFSTDQGHTWSHHTVITDSGGFNYTAIREVSPGRLLYIHDAPNLRALYVDVELVK